MGGGGLDVTRNELKRRLYLYKDLKSEYQQLGATIVRLKFEHSNGAPATPAVQFRLNEINKNYERQREKLLDAMMEVEQLIERLDDPKARELMRCRYLDGMGWEDVCKAINYSWSQTHRIHGKALNDLLNLVNRESRKGA